MPRNRYAALCLSDTDLPEKQTESDFSSCSLLDLENWGFAEVVYDDGRLVVEDEDEAKSNTVSAVRSRSKVVALCNEIVALKRADKLNDVAEQFFKDLRNLWDKDGGHMTTYEQAKLLSVLGKLHAVVVTNNTNRWKRVLTDFRSFILSQSDSSTADAGATQVDSPRAFAFREILSMPASEFGVMSIDAKSALCNIITGLDSKYMHFKASKLARKRACDAISRVLENQRECRRAMVEGHLDDFLPLPPVERRCSDAAPIDLVVLPSVSADDITVLTVRQERRMEEILQKLSHGQVGHTTTSTTSTAAATTTHHRTTQAGSIGAEDNNSNSKCGDGGSVSREVVLPNSDTTAASPASRRTPPPNSGIRSRMRLTSGADNTTSADGGNEFRQVMSRNDKRLQRERNFQQHHHTHQHFAAVAPHDPVVVDWGPSANRQHSEIRPACCYYLLGKCDYGRQCVFWHPPDGAESDQIVCKYGRVCHVNHGRQVCDQEHALILGKFLHGEHGDFETDRVRHYLKVSHLDSLVADATRGYAFPPSVVQKWNAICGEIDGSELLAINSLWQRHYGEKFPYERHGFESLRHALESFPGVRLTPHPRTLGAFVIRIMKETEEKTAAASSSGNNHETSSHKQALGRVGGGNSATSTATAGAAQGGPLLAKPSSTTATTPSPQLQSQQSTPPTSTHPIPTTTASAVAHPSTKQTPPATRATAAPWASTVENAVAKAQRTVSAKTPTTAAASSGPRNGSASEFPALSSSAAAATGQQQQRKTMTAEKAAPKKAPVVPSPNESSGRRPPAIVAANTHWVSREEVANGVVNNKGEAKEQQRPVTAVANATTLASSLSATSPSPASLPGKTASVAQGSEASTATSPSEAEVQLRQRASANNGPPAAGLVGFGAHNVGFGDVALDQSGAASVIFCGTIPPPPNMAPPPPGEKERQSQPTTALGGPFPIQQHHLQPSMDQHHVTPNELRAPPPRIPLLPDVDPVTPPHELLISSIDDPGFHPQKVSSVCRVCGIPCANLVCQDCLASQLAGIETSAFNYNLGCLRRGDGMHSPNYVDCDAEIRQGLLAAAAGQVTPSLSPVDAFTPEQNSRAFTAESDKILGFDIERYQRLAAASGETAASSSEHRMFPFGSIMADRNSWHVGAANSASNGDVRKMLNSTTGNYMPPSPRMGALERQHHHRGEGDVSHNNNDFGSSPFVDFGGPSHYRSGHPQDDFLFRGRSPSPTTCPDDHGFDDDDVFEGAGASLASAAARAQVAAAMWGRLSSGQYHGSGERVVSSPSNSNSMGSQPNWPREPQQRDPSDTWRLDLGTEGVKDAQSRKITNWMWNGGIMNAAAYHHSTPQS